MPDGYEGPYMEPRSHDEERDVTDGLWAWSESDLTETVEVIEPDWRCHNVWHHFSVFVEPRFFHHIAVKSPTDNYAESLDRLGDEHPRAWVYQGRFRENIDRARCQVKGDIVEWQKEAWPAWMDVD